MLNLDDKNEIRKMIEQESVNDFRRRIGDTPTDKLQLTPKKYVDDQRSSVYSSIQAGFTFIGNVIFNGTASVAGNFRVGGSASVAGSFNYQGVQLPRLYIGAIGSVGAASTPFPSGFTSSLVGVGSTRVTHNFSSTEYVVHATGVDNIAEIAQRNTDNFLIRSTTDGSTVSTDSGIYFTVYRP